MNPAFEPGNLALLRQAHRNNWQHYLDSLRINQTDASPRPGWDHCILTASNERQAEIVRRQLAWRRTVGLLPTGTEFHIVTDPSGLRIGSGGATLRILSALFGDGLTASDWGSSLRDLDCAQERILIVHSGGDSRRLPHCSATGKLFARVPRELPDGRASTIFDELLINLSGLARELPPGVLLASGDVLLVFDHLQLSFHRAGVTGVSVAAPIATGRRHGVYVAEGDHHQVKAFLHKPGGELLDRWNAVAADGHLQIDTGLVWLDAETAGKFADLAAQPELARLCGLAEPSCDQAEQINLYGDLLLPLAQSTTWEAYRQDDSDGAATPRLKCARKIIWERLRGTPFSVERLQPAVFVHFGSSQEYLHMVTADAELANLCGWAREASAWVPENPEASSSPALINAALDVWPQIDQGDLRPMLVVDSYLGGSISWRGSALVAGLQTEQDIHLGHDRVVHQLPVKGGFVTRVYGLHDDPKQHWQATSTTYTNASWQRWLDKLGLAPEQLWQGIAPDDWSLWNARLFPVSDDRETSLRLTLPLQAPTEASANWRDEWQAAPRLSLADSFAAADAETIVEDIRNVEDLVAARHFWHGIAEEAATAQIAPLLNRAGERALRRRSQLVASWLDEASPVIRLRGYAALATALAELRSETRRAVDWEGRAFLLLAQMIEEDVGRTWSAQAPVRSVNAHQENRGHVKVAAAARIDFGGGWSDTPPYSIERGGIVLNAAITLRGANPISAEARRLDEPRLILESRDIDDRREPKLAGDILNYANPSDPFALHKSALVLKGIIPGDAPHDLPLSDLLSMHGGVRLITQTNIPRGSGLGVSSIMAGVVLTCLDRLSGQETSQEQLFDEVLYLEQMLTTGGGWQDQVGGLVDGIKLVTTEPGLPQKIETADVRLTAATADELDERLLVVYTGQQRLAKNLLRSVMGRWMARDPEMVSILHEIGQLALTMRAALQAGNLDEFGELLGEHWSLNKRMDPGCTNPFIDELFSFMSPFIAGGKLAGAGGGGFAMVVAKSTESATTLNDALTSQYAGTRVAIWPSAIASPSVTLELLG